MIPPLPHTTRIRNGMVPLHVTRAPLTRRDFLLASTAAALLAVRPAAAALRPPSALRAAPLRVVFTSAGGDADLVRGVRFGAAEMQHTAKLLRSSFHLVETSVAGAAALPDATAATVIICGAAHDARLLGRESPHVVLDASAVSEAAACGARVFRLGLSAGELKSVAPGRVEYWHPSLVRYGAGQLNERFERTHSTGMTSAAWLGWMAVKTAWEAAQRTNGTASDMAEFLSSERAHFDGHKGEALRFDVRTHWLVQPLYVTGGGDVVQIASETAAAAVAGEAACAQH